MESKPNSDVIVAPNDNRVFKTLSLKNDLKVIVVQDPKSIKTGVALNVNVGHFHDPAKWQGAAHYLEHMVFMGSSRHKKPYILKKLIENNNGHYNASTDRDSTVYYFDIDSRKIEEALKLFSQAIDSPMLEPEITQKELSAVHNEWEGSYKTDQATVSAVYTNSVNPKHPKAKFGGGNQLTLQLKNGVSPSQALSKFYQKHYSSNLMSLVIVGNESVDILGSYAKRYFSDVRNNQLEPIQIDVEAFDIEHTGLRIDVEILSRTKQLILQFPLRSQKDLWMTKSNKVIEYLLNSKESGTLYDTLKSQGYISDIVSTVDYHELVNAGVITINMTLTDKGVVSEDLIVGSFFNYISLMNQDTLKPQFGEVVKKQLTRAWEEMETGDPLDVAITLSNALHLYDPQFVVSHAYIMSEMNLRHIISILKDITPQKMRLWVLSDTAVTDTKLNYAKGSFSTRKLNLAEFDRWDKSGLQTLKLPSVNNEFENLSQEQVPLAKVTGKPQVMFDQFGKRLLFSSGKNVENGEGVITLRLNAHAPTKTAINWLASNIMVNNILSDLQPSIQRLKTATGSESSIYLSRNAEPIIQLAGNTQGHMTMLNTMLDKLLNYRMSKEEFEESVKLLSSAILDRKLLSIYDDMPYKFGQTVSSPGNQFSNDQLLEGLRKISIDDIFSFNTELLKSAFIDAFAMGHYDSNSLVAFMQKFRPNEPQYEAVSPWLFKMDSQKIINKAAKYSSQQDGVGLMTAYFKKAEIDVNTKVQMDVLAKLLSTPYLEFMRTENELGYIAQLFSAQTGNIPFVGAIVISNSEPRNILRDKSKAFFSDYLKTLKTVSSSEIKNLKESMIGDLQVPTTSLYEEYTYYFSDWEINEINFTSKNSQIKALNNVTRESIVTLYERLFLSTKSTKIEISIQNKNIN